MTLDNLHIFVIFFGIQLLSDKDFSDQRLQRGGTVFLAHCLTVVFHVICIDTHLICDMHVVL